MKFRLTSLLLLIFALPASTNYQLKGYGIGGGGEENAASTTYGLYGVLGEVSATTLDGTTYDLKPGNVYAQLANVPTMTFTNSANYYNKLAFVVNTQSNPTDTTYVIAISTDNFVTTNYIQADGTIGSSPVYQTYAQWGGASGEFVTGLASNTTYKVKAKAYHGKYSESAFGPESSAATVSPTLVFDIDVSSIDTNTDPPFNVTFSDLNPGSVIDSNEKVWVDFETNAEGGGRVYVSGSNTGLSSATTSHTITSVTGNLTSLGEGYGAQGSSATQTSGGAFSISSAYSLASSNVAVIDTTFREIFETNNPVVGGRGSFILKAKSSNVTPAADDYTETLTLIASAVF